MAPATTRGRWRPKRRGDFLFVVQLLSFSRGAKAAALNYALPAATGRYLVFTDDDLRFDELWLLKLLAPLRAAQAEAVVGEIRLAPHLTRPWMEPTHRAMLAEVRPNDERHQLVGANMAISRECFNLVGAFDPALGVGALGSSEEVLLDRQIRSKRRTHTVCSRCRCRAPFRPQKTGAACLDPPRQSVRQF